MSSIVSFVPLIPIHYPCIVYVHHDRASIKMALHLVWHSISDNWIKHCRKIRNFGEFWQSIWDYCGWLGNSFTTRTTRSNLVAQWSWSQLFQRYGYFLTGFLSRCEITSYVFETLAPDTLSCYQFFTVFSLSNNGFLILRQIESRQSQQNSHDEY